jgi:hypothetical protein
MSSLSYQYWQDIDKALSESGDKPLAEADKIRLTANTIVSLAPKDKLDNELAKLAVNSIDPEYIQEALSEASVGPELTSDRLDGLLAKRAETALEDITNRNYHQVIGSEAKEIIYLGMAIYGHGAEVKAVFGPK